ncbi:MAG: MFS transporter [Acidobacteriia bacterium]|nr:MFS transporter [Terriglobia bacterium]
MNSQKPPVQNLEPSAVTPTALSNARRWSIVALLFVAGLINYLDRATVSVALPNLAKDMLLSPIGKGVLLSAFFWSYALMQVPIGWCTDRYNMRWLYAGAFTLWSVACGLTGLAGSLFVLILCRVLLGIGESIFLPGGTKTVSMMFPAKERGLPTGLFESGSRFGLALGAPLIAWLVMRHGWRNMFFLIGFTAFLWLIPWFGVFRDHLPNAPTEPRGPAQAAPTPRSHTPTLDRNLLGICLGAFCYGYYWFLLVTWLPDYLMTVRHLPLLKAGFYASLPYFVFAVGSPIGGWIADRLIRLGWDETRTRKGIVTLAFLAGLLLIPAAWVASARTALILFGGASLVGTSAANLLVIVQNCAPGEEVGVWTGMENLVGNAAGILAPIITGLLVAWTGSYLPGFALAVVVLLAGLLAFWFVVGELKPLGQPTWRSARYSPGGDR